METSKLDEAIESRIADTASKAQEELKKEIRALCRQFSDSGIRQEIQIIALVSTLRDIVSDICVNDLKNFR